MEVKIKDFILDSNFLMGVVGDYCSFIRVFKDIDFSKNTIYINKKRLNIKEKKDLRKKIVIIEDNIFNYNKSLTVYDYMKYSVLESLLHLKDYRRRIKDSLKIVGLSESYLEKRICFLSSYEWNLILLAKGLLSNPDIIIINDLFRSFDRKNSKKLLTLFTQLIERYHKIVVFCSNDSEFIYKYTKKLIVFSEQKILIQGDTSKIYEENFDLLKKNHIEIPNEVLFTNLVLSNKGIRLSYHKDIRDLIKDIYKKV